MSAPRVQTTFKTAHHHDTASHTAKTYGYSRDDVNTFLPDYIAKDILPVDPFQSLDQTGVGQLVEMGLKRGRQTNKGLKVGICGEHGGDPRSIRFCHELGLDYVSCSPFRVPIARIAASNPSSRSPATLDEHATSVYVQLTTTARGRNFAMNPATA